MSFEKSNRVAVLSEVGSIVLEDRTVPVPSADEVLIRVDAVGVCGSDAHYFRHGRIGQYIVDAPLVLGHETSGTVIGVGEQVTAHRIGDRVAIEPGVPCGRCAQCRSGRYNLCPDVVFHATPPVDGTLQEYVTIRADFAFILPESVPTEHGALVEPLAVSVWACRKARVAPGSRVLVTGAGPVGLLTAQTARAFGASHVTVTDVDPEKLQLALELGADATIAAADLADDDGVYDVHIECSGNARATRDGIASLDRAGVTVLVGMGAAEGLDIPASWIQEKELVITGVFRYANCFPAAIDLLATGRVRVEQLISARYPLAESGVAVDSAGRAGVFKTLILPQL